MTKNQNHIPQVYMRDFSPEYEKGSKSYPNSRYTIYCYDLNVKKNMNLCQLSLSVIVNIYTK